MAARRPRPRPLLLAALLGTGWRIAPTKGSHYELEYPGRRMLELAFHDGAEIGPRMVAKIAKEARLRREDL